MRSSWHSDQEALPILGTRMQLSSQSSTWKATSDNTQAISRTTSGSTESWPDFALAMLRTCIWLHQRKDEMGSVHNWKSICSWPRSSVKNTHISSLRSWHFFKATSCALGFLTLPLGLSLHCVETLLVLLANCLCSLSAASSSDCSGKRPRNVHQQSEPMK